MKGTCIRCGKPFNSVDDIHTCTPPRALALADECMSDVQSGDCDCQRCELFRNAAAELRRLHELYEQLREQNTELDAKLAEAEALLRQALDVLENHTAIKHPQQIYYRDSAITAIRARLGDAQ